MKRTDKTIFHMDGDAFFVGVEVAKDARLKGLPVVVGAERGIATAISYEAKALGVTRGMPVFQIRKKFPTVIVMHGDYKSYVEYSAKMFDIVRRYADDVEEYSVDECFADLTGLDKPLKMSYREIAERIKNEVNKELGLSISVGLGPTKVLAKVASKYIKPNGLTVIEKKSINEFLSQTPIGKVWGIGWRTTILLQKKGISTALDFVSKNKEWINNLAKPYRVIWEELQGNSVLDVDPYPKTIYSSIQKTRTFHPSTDDEVFLLSQFSKNIEEACTKARYFDLIPRRISFFLKTKDFRYINFSSELSIPTNAPEMIMNLLKLNLKRIYSKGVLYRSTGVVLQELVPQGCMQEDLFGNLHRSKKFESVHRAIDSLEDKYGKKIVYLASTHNAIKRKSKGSEREDLDRDLLFL